VAVENAPIGPLIDEPEASSVNGPEGFSRLEMMMAVTLILIIASIST
jgi:prepilin-type N-terminal cleavage/methylation domain-containing protein